MANNTYSCNLLTGGTAGCLDDIDHDNLSDADIAIVIHATNSKFYMYDYNSSSSTAESSPDVINPDSNSGAGRWILNEGVMSDLEVTTGDLNVTAGNVDIAAGTLGLASGTTITEFSTDGTLAGNSDNAVPTEKAVTTFMNSLSSSITSRSAFTYNGGATAYTIKVGGGIYNCKDKYCFWNSELTTSAIGTPAASTVYYLYLDYSAITSMTAITATELVWSDTAPTWNHTYKGWMNSDDLCIFAVVSNSGPTNILEFFHDTNFVMYADSITDRANADLDTTWVDVTLTIPACCRQAECAMFAATPGSAGASSLYWRTNGQTGTTGHVVCQVNADSGLQYNTVKVHTDSSLKIEVKHSASDDSTCGVHTNGWYLPIGM